MCSGHSCLAHDPGQYIITDGMSCTDCQVRFLTFADPFCAALCGRISCLEEMWERGWLFWGQSTSVFKQITDLLLDLQVSIALLKGNAELAPGVTEHTAPMEHHGAGTAEEHSPPASSLCLAKLESQNH